MFVRRFVLALSSLLFATAAMAATLAERSPFLQGHWWNPARSGNGFEIFNTADQAMVIWYTYDDAGRPIWYTAQGDVASLGTQQSWPLLQHRWSAGRRAGAEVVGTLRLDVRHPESIDVAWNLHGKSGIQRVEPYTLSGTVSEVDHTGSWFDPANSGWGFTFTEQGEFVGGVLFTYDAAGAPTWVAGFERNDASVELYTASGACPSCAYTPTVLRSAGRLGFEFRGETEMVLRNNLTLAMADGVHVDGAKVAQLGRSASMRAADRQLASFDTGKRLKAYLDAGMMNMPPPSAAADFSAPPPAAVYSLTNLQEAGVDEADLVKSNGRHVYTFAHVGGTRQPVLRIARVGPEGADLEVRGSVALTSGGSTPMANAGLFLQGPTLVSLTGTTSYSYGITWFTPTAWQKGRALVEVMSLANPDLPQTTWRAELDGHLVASRRIGDRIYVATRFVPYMESFSYGNTAPDAVARNRTLLANASLDSLLPKASVNGGPSVPLVETSAVYSTPQGSRKLLADMIVITAIDLRTPRIAQSMAILGGVETVYASTGSLVVASSRYDMRSPAGTLLPSEPPIYFTDLHRISLSPDAMTLAGSGTIEGYLGTDPDKSAFRLSESDGRVRALSASQMWGAGRNRVTILEPSTLTPGLLKVVSVLPNAKRPQMLGKPNELLYGARFMGDRLYAVTFKKVDPLYVVDLSDPADPRIAGELEMPGFSDYLHPLPNGLLLGFGKDARPADTTGDAQFAWFQGLQLSLFDVADAGKPREIQRVLMGKRGSDSALLRHHHAFSALTLTDSLSTIAIPARLHDGTPTYSSGDASIYPWQESGLMRFELRGKSAADAQLVRMPSLITHRLSSANPYPPADDASYDGARSILFRNGTLYIGKGQFWRQDIGGATYGPL
jgi:uncharacterized secreted protein with C-terminal beta-propeller domain